MPDFSRIHPVLATKSLSHRCGSQLTCMKEVDSRDANHRIIILYKAL